MATHRPTNDRRQPNRVPARYAVPIVAATVVGHRRRRERRRRRPGQGQLPQLAVWAVLQDSSLGLFGSGHLTSATAMFIRFSPDGFKGSTAIGVAVVFRVMGYHRHPARPQPLHGTLALGRSLWDARPSLPMWCTVSSVVLPFLPFLFSPPLQSTAVETISSAMERRLSARPERAGLEGQSRAAWH